MVVLKNFWLKYRFTTAYILFVVMLNCFFIYLPNIHVASLEFNIGDIVVGVIYLLRDFTQREIQQKVLLATLLGAMISYFLADKSVAIASVLAFTVGETLDWIIYTISKKPFSQRLLWSSLISAPIDSFVFLWAVSRMNFTELTIMTVAKMAGVILLWLSWRLRTTTVLRGSIAVA